MGNPHLLRRAAPLPDIDLNPRRDPPLDFPDRPFGELTPTDYQTLGFMCGLEVHQQLKTARKLFCRCPAGRHTTRVDAEILRHMRPTLSELGDYDGCALMEFKTRKEIVYLLERSTVCTYELDDTPPFEIDPEAVRAALEVSAMFGLNLVSELQVMRKQYLDGSIPTGFQRTGMIGIGGSIPFRTSEVGADTLRIRQLTLEEDSCREVSDIGHRITFRTDRLGMPLIETVTEPSLLTPADVEAGCRLIASVARASGLVRRGIGAARQDVNVSIAGGRRIELKGVMSFRQLPRLVHTEALRQLNLLRLREELIRRGVKREMFPSPGAGDPWQTSHLAIDATKLLAGCGARAVREAIARGDTVVAVRLPGFRGLLRHRTQPEQVFASEVADRLRVIACLDSTRRDGRPFLLHDDVDDSALGGADWRELRSELAADTDDAVVVVWGPREDVATAAREVLNRADDAVVGVPSETRQTYRDGSTGFERILPGPQRMYPDTDTPPLPIPDAWIAGLDGRLKPAPWDRADRYVATGLAPAAATRLAAAPWADLFDELAPATPATAGRLAAAFEKRLVHFWRASRSRDLPAAVRLRPLVAAADAGRLRLEAFEAVFDRLLSERGRPPEQIVTEHAPSDDPELRARLVSSAAALVRSEVKAGTDLAMLRWAMGRVLADPRRGTLAAAEIRTLLITELQLRVDGDAA